MAEFILDPRIAADTYPVGALDLSTLRLMREARFPWAILVPQRPGLSELFELTRADRAMLMEEIAAVSEAMQNLTGCAKVNVAALGNHVRQLHVHVIARRPDDAAWPNAAFGAGPAVPYPPGAGEAFAASLAKALQIGEKPNTI